MKYKLWWNIQVIFSKLIYDPLLLDFLTVLPPNKFSWEDDSYDIWKLKQKKEK